MSLIDSNQVIRGKWERQTRVSVDGQLIEPLAHPPTFIPTYPHAFTHTHGLTCVMRREVIVQCNSLAHIDRSTQSAIGCLGEELVYTPVVDSPAEVSGCITVCS